MNIPFPFAVSATGLVQTTEPSDHIFQMIQQILFTSPGERVNRPQFGSELRRLVFAPADATLTAAVESMAQSVLHQWLGDIIKIEAIEIQTAAETVTVNVQYSEIINGKRRVAQMTV